MPRKITAPGKNRFEFSGKIAARVLLIVFGLSLLPLLAVSFYNRQSADDFAYGGLAANAWRSTGSLLQVFNAAINQVRQSYLTWQGTFSAIFLFSLQPAVFSEKLYFLTTFITLFSFIISSLYFLHVLLVRHIKADTRTWLILSLIILLFSIQLAPSVSEAFFWFNGGIYYTFFYSLFLVLTGLILNLPLVETKTKTIFHAVFILLLSAFISGGNFTTALVTSLTVLLFCLIYALKKVKHRQIVYLSLLLVLLGMIISIRAPGNAFRSQALLEESIQPLPFIKTILYSFLYGASLMLRWTSPLLLGVLVLLIPLMWKTAKTCSYSFKYPALAVIGSYCLFSAQLAPPLFAMSYIGDGRLINIYYDLYMMMVILNTFYLVGWYRKLLESGTSNIAVKLRKISLSKNAGKMILFAAAVLTLIFMGINLQHTACVKATRMLVQNEAQLFAEKRDKRTLIYKNPLILDAIVEPIPEIPGLFYQMDLEERDWWVNQAVADYYDKRTVSLLQE